MFTNIDMRGEGSSVDARMVASALDCSSKQLPCLKAIGHLSQLTALEFRDAVSGVCERALMQLTGLSSLRSLELTPHYGYPGTDEMLDRFWAALRQQRH